MIVRYDISVVFRIQEHVKRAVASGEAVVALESTVISHGLPKPHNLELAYRLEDTVRQAGAVPATVGVIAGELVVGLDAHEIDMLANAEVQKASLWNLPSLAASGQSAGTTVAATMHGAQLAGISVFATGGIGGVHHAPYDESADLSALARYPLIVVCAGAKSILNVAATMERLEMLGVPVLGYQSDTLAGFYTRETPYNVVARCDEASSVVRHFMTQRALGYQSALLLSKPVSQGLLESEVERWSAQASSEASAHGLTGREVTPYLLKRFAELSNGRATDVNVRLLVENAELAARVARELKVAREPLMADVTP